MVRSCFFIALLGLAALQAAAAPVGKLSTEHVDFGEIAPDAYALKSVNLSNGGDAPLIVERVSSSCPCLSAPELKEETAIAPGESMDLKLLYKPDGLIGEKAASLAIFTNDPNTPVFIIETVVSIKATVVVKPPEGVSFGYAPRGYLLHKDLQFRAYDEEANLVLQSIEVRHPEVSVETESGRDEKSAFVLATFTLSNATPLGRLETVVDATFTVGDDTKTLSLPIHGTVLGDVLITPSAINSPKSVRPRGEKISEISVRTPLKGQEPPRIIEAFAEGSLTLKIRNGDEPGVNKIDVFVGDDAAPGPNAARVYVITDSADQPIVRLPVFFRVEEQVQLNPPLIAMDSSGGDAEIEILNSQGTPIEIERIETGDGVDAKLIGGTGVQGDPLRVRVGVKAGSHGSRLTLHFTDPALHSVVIPVVAR